MDKQRRVNRIHCLSSGTTEIGPADISLKMSYTVGMLTNPPWFFSISGNLISPDQVIYFLSNSPLMWEYGKKNKGKSRRNINVLNIKPHALSLLLFPLYFPKFFKKYVFAIYLKLHIIFQ